MDISRGLITRLIDDDRLYEVKRSGIDDSFLDEDSQQVFQYIERHYSDYKSVPSRSAIKQAFPNYNFTDYKEPLEYFITQLKESYRRQVLEDSLLDIKRLYGTDTKEAELRIREALSALSITERSFKDRDIADNSLERLTAYYERKAKPGPDGIRSGWEKVDWHTLGWHKEELIVIVGEKYEGKSWLMLWMGHEAMLQKERVLFVTKEMSQVALERRFDAIHAKVSFDSLRRGELTGDEEGHLRNALTNLSDSNYKVIFARDGVETIDDIEAKAIELDSTIVFIDSVYLFNADRRGTFTGETPRRMAISQRCKKMARTLGVPVIVSTQGGRKKSKNEGAHLDRIEWSNAFAQDADVVLFWDRDDIDKELNRGWVHLLKTRDGDTGIVSIKTDWAYSQFPQDNIEKEPSMEIDVDDEEGSFNYT